MISPRSIHPPTAVGQTAERKVASLYGTSFQPYSAISQESRHPCCPIATVRRRHRTSSIGGESLFSVSMTSSSGSRSVNAQPGPNQQLPAAESSLVQNSLIPGPIPDAIIAEQKDFLENHA
ncbi:hypothetical protein K443DRAFT_564110 [Laccaria amethystina LaAM-08-1]|uniref:Uncharacterized protein n=1 Tax=Laccaria amethystina LaAM-08-1 TaxID=1095629 RepID=A0A0C9WS49_9AGAR|nr:hypothetical protein K443DRAFT_564110 [Laccaria amethystina LaAM-08-1]